MELFGGKPLRPADCQQQIPALEKAGVDEQLEALIYLNIGGGRNGDAKKGGLDDPNFDVNSTGGVEAVGGNDGGTHGIVDYPATLRRTAILHLLSPKCCKTRWHRRAS